MSEQHVLIPVVSAHSVCVCVFCPCAYNLHFSARPIIVWILCKGIYKKKERLVIVSGPRLNIFPSQKHPSFRTQPFPLFSGSPLSMWQPWDRTFRGHLSEGQLRIFFFCNVVPPHDFHSRLSCHSWCPTCIPLLCYILSISRTETVFC